MQYTCGPCTISHSQSSGTSSTPRVLVPSTPPVLHQSLIVLIAKIYYICHLFSCIWYFIGAPNSDYPPDKAPPDKQGLCPYTCLTLIMDGEGRDPGPCPISRDPLSAYYYTGKEPCDDSVTWVRYHMLYELSHWQRFWASMYYVTKTVLGVGYGDIVPVASGERVYSIFIAISGSIFYGFILAGIANFADSKSHDGAKLQEVSDWLEWRR